jgi:hypothetical protein
MYRETVILTQVASMVLVIDVSNDDALYNEVVAAAELCYETFHV